MVYKPATTEPDLPSTTQNPPIYASSPFPSDLPARSAPPGQTWKSRNCPHARTCWSFSLSSYSLKDIDNSALARRVCMIAILALRLAMSVLSTIAAVAVRKIASAVFYAILGVLGL